MVCAYARVDGLVTTVLLHNGDLVYRYRSSFGSIFFTMLRRGRQKYKKDNWDRMYGFFRCDNCGKTWESAHVYCFSGTTDVSKCYYLDGHC